MKVGIVLAAVGIVAIIAISGCTQLNGITKVFCEPNYVRPSTGSQIASALVGQDCKTLCYNQYQTTSFKVESNSCYCDVNKCG